MPCRWRVHIVEKEGGTAITKVLVGDATPFTHWKKIPSACMDVQHHIDHIVHAASFIRAAVTQFDTVPATAVQQKAVIEQNSWQPTTASANCHPTQPILHKKPSSAHSLVTEHQQHQAEAKTTPCDDNGSANHNPSPLGQLNGPDWRLALPIPEQLGTASPRLHGVALLQLHLPHSTPFHPRQALNPRPHTHQASTLFDGGGCLVGHGHCVDVALLQL